MPLLFDSVVNIRFLKANMQGQVLVFGIIFCSSVLYSALLSVNLLYIYVCVFVAVSVSTTRMHRGVACRGTVRDRLPERGSRNIVSKF